MKTLPLHSAHYQYLETAYCQWLQIIGYADPTVNKWPVHVRELLHYLESRHIHHITVVTATHVQDFIRYIKYRSNHSRPGALSSSSINTIINAVSSFARYLNSTGQYMLDITPIRAEADAAMPVVLTVEEIKQLYEASFLPQRENSLAMGQRDRAIIAVFYGCGLRRQEGIALNLTDIDLGKGLLFVSKGKGGKQRYVPVAARHLEDLRSYITTGREWFVYEHYARDYTNKFAQRKKQADDDALFIGQNGQRMKSFYKRLHCLAEKAGMDKRFGLHTLRHSIATHLLQSGMPIEEIARFLGHASLDSTQLYTHLAHELKTDQYGGL